MYFNGVSHRRLMVSAVLLVSLGIAESAYDLYRMYRAEDRIEELAKKIDSFGFDSKDAIYADYEAYSKGMHDCDIKCAGRVQSFRKNSKETACVCQTTD